MVLIGFSALTDPEGIARLQARASWHSRWGSPDTRQSMDALSQRTVAGAVSSGPTGAALSDADPPPDGRPRACSSSVRVVGLQASQRQTARRGRLVRRRPAVAEQVKSLGAAFSTSASAARRPRALRASSP
jgi:hypothetical protein